MLCLACGLTLYQLQGHSVSRHIEGNIALPTPVAHTGASILEQKTAEEAAIASLGLFHCAGGRKQNKSSYSFSLNLMALTLKSPSTARYSIFSMPSRLGNWNSASGTFTVASVSLKEMQICREPQEGRLTHHSSQASFPTASSLGAGQRRWLLVPRSLAEPPPCPVAAWQRGSLFALPQGQLQASATQG